MSLRVVLGVVPLGVWFAITEHSTLRVARARWSGSPSGRQCVPAGCSRVPPDGGCSVAGRGWVHCRARTRPSGRRLLRRRQGRGSLPGAHTSIWTAAVLWPAGAGFTAGRTHVHPDGSRFVAGRGWVHCRAHTRPFGRRLVRSRQGLGSLPGAHTSVRTAAVS